MESVEAEERMRRRLSVQSVQVRTADGSKFSRWIGRHKWNTCGTLPDLDTTTLQQQQSDLHRQGAGELQDQPQLAAPYTIQKLSSADILELQLHRNPVAEKDGYRTCNPLLLGRKSFFDRITSFSCFEAIRFYSVDFHFSSAPVPSMGLRIHPLSSIQQELAEQHQCVATISTTWLFAVWRLASSSRKGSRSRSGSIFHCHHGSHSRLPLKRKQQGGTAASPDSQRRSKTIERSGKPTVTVVLFFV